MARNCGILAFTPSTWAASTQKSDLDTAVSNVMTACLANSTIAALVPDSAGSINVAALSAAVTAALANVQVPPTAAPTSTLLVELAVQIANLFTDWKNTIENNVSSATNYTLNAIGAAAFEALAINRGVSSTLKSSVELDLDDQVVGILNACHANANILALEPGVAGSQVTKALSAATHAILSNLGTDGITPSEMTALAALIYTTYTEVVSVIGVNTDFCSTAAGAAAYAVMGADRGLSSGENNNGITVLLGTVRAYVAGCNANTTFSGYGNSTAGSQLTKAISAASQIALANLDIESIVNIVTVVPTTALTAAVNMVVALITEINSAIT
jgi:hypothetical protein